MKYSTEKSILPILWTAIAIKAALILTAFILPVNLLDYSESQASGNRFTDSAPEIWLSLMAFVFGTLIIVVSIASEKTPKLIDLFVTEYWSCLFIWLIALSALENIFLHFQYSAGNRFVDNVIFLNNYVLLPGFIVTSIPYIFYILKYTKTSSVVRRLFIHNLRTIKAGGKVSSASEINENHLTLLESVNQLNDLLQYVEFKEPQADIIHKLGISIRYYLKKKSLLSESYFRISNSIKNDISFITLSDKSLDIQDKRTFYEQKVLRSLSNSYLMLTRGGNYDLASLCGNELYETGKTALELKDENVVDTVIIYFNTMLRFGINNGIKAREIRNVYNTIFHYSHLVDLFIEKRQEHRIVQCCRYFRFYADEIRTKSLSEPVFYFLVEVFAVELKKILISIYNQRFPRPLQVAVLTTFNALGSQVKKHRIHDNGLRQVQVALCLFYMKNKETEFIELIVFSMIRELEILEKSEASRAIYLACDKLAEASAEFWEETDQGNENIYYSPDKEELPRFLSYFSDKLTAVDNVIANVGNP